VNHATTRGQELWQEGHAWDDIVRILRAEGFSKIESIRATMGLLRVPLAEAKRLIHFSTAWSDVRARDNAFHSLAAAALAADGNDGSPAGMGGSRSDRELAQHLVGVVTALREGNVGGARALIDEVVAEDQVERVVLLSGVLAAALAEMAEIGQENLLEALGILVATTSDASAGEAADALARAEAALAAR
jgi:hypothetical protein